ncbi:DNA translocase FtsK [Pseudalkalibacillus salsuginis]|uniref:DNA translocase FtsK n=1 Tax=Pseudalkalibacillus salsuginis TaxID=2910972 RepID=UPI001F28DD70|nr:DNA translocase FtsK [Pseudalkalibacillus salsuginis]MCF6408817.1 DNA translocase FtsK [Pseudalkalibacillus salsuginis]
MSKWLKKMIDLIFDDEEEIEGEKPNNKRASRTTSEYERKGKSVGRITTAKGSFEPKMKYQYPKDGNFRFPVIPDDKDRDDSFETPDRNKRAKKQLHENEPEQKHTDKGQLSRSRRESRVNQAGERPKFTGKNFKPAEIPSPIYGFRSRPEVFPPEIGPESAGIISSKKHETEPSHEPGYEAFQAVSGMRQDQFSNETDPIESEKPESPILGWDFKEESKMDNEQAEDSISKSKSTEESPNHEPEEGIELIPWTDMDQERDEETHVEPEEGSIGRDTYYNKTSSIQETSEPLKPENNEKASQDQNVQVDRSEIPEKKKSPIPFNVMMLQRDRQSRSTPDKKDSGSVSSKPAQAINSGYIFPSESLLDREIQEINDDDTWLDDQIELLQSTLHDFNVKATVIGATKGPSVTRIEVQPAPGVKVNKITNLSDDIKLSLAAKDIRMEAPIPGRNAIGIEVPNKVSKSVTLREIITHPNFAKSPSPLSVALGLDISGNPVVTDLQKMPHGLIAGATGSGKSVCINSLLISILYKAHPDDVRLMLIDPKMVELAPYNHLPHLVTPVITDAKEATLGLKWAVDEMERRYELFAKTGVRDMERFNKLVKEKGEPDQKLPYVVVIIDELADLMMVSPQEVEDSICRIAQKARACGIHLLLATQRPSVDVITGLIKANIPTRIAFSVSSAVDSRTIIDTNGADKLLGKGDMLFLGHGVSKPVRIQGNFVSDEEIERITVHVKGQREPDYLFEKEELIQNTMAFEQNDELFDEACEFVFEQGAASSSALQRRFRIGYNRAARLVDMMEARGIVSEAMGSKPRNVLVSKQEFYDQVSE